MNARRANRPTVRSRSLIRDRPVSDAPLQGVASGAHRRGWSRRAHAGWARV